MKFLFMDSGGFSVDCARQVAQEGHLVHYYTPWQVSYAAFDSFAPGVGVPELNRVMDWAPYVDDVDCIVFPGVGMGQLADWLRHKGYVVFGAGLGEEMEQDRIKSCQVMEKLGVKYPKTHHANGVKATKELLLQLIGQKTETNQNATGKVFVKFNVWRGTMDSFPVGSMEEAEYMLNKVISKFGPYANQVPMIIQETVEGIETGADLFFNGEHFVMPGMWGFEDGGNYLGLITDDMGIFKNDLDRVARYFRSVNYRGAFSFECIFDGKDCYWIDWTCRFPMPMGLMYPTFIPNFGEFLGEIATGNAQTSRLPTGEYLACMQLKSENAMDEYLKLQGGKNTKFTRYMMDDGKAFAVPGSSILGISSSHGDSFAECQRGIEDESKALNIFFLDKDEGFIQTIKEKYVTPISELGVSFGPESVASDTPKSLPAKSLESKLAELDRWGIPS